MQANEVAIPYGLVASVTIKQNVVGFFNRITINPSPLFRRVVAITEIGQFSLVIEILYCRKIRLDLGS